MKFNRIIAVVAFVLSTWTINAQIGYQVSLLNSATGEPRANETVNVTVQITNSESAVICTETKSATTDDFGVLSLQVGTENTFKNVDWSKLPLYVSATVDGIMVGKSQILNVPVAEAAKTLVNVAPELICKTWSAFVFNRDRIEISLFADMSFTYKYYYNNTDLEYNASGIYEIVGNMIYLLAGGATYNFCPASLYYHNTHLYGQTYHCLLKFDLL